MSAVYAIWKRPKGKPEAIAHIVKPPGERRLCDDRIPKGEQEQFRAWSDQQDRFGPLCRRCGGRA